MSLTSEDIRAILERYFVKGDRSPDIVQFDEPELDVDMTVVKLMLERPDIHDEDYRVFQHFKKENTTILDIGANFGYSAAAIWMVGSKASVISFEPINRYELIFAEMERLKNPRKSFKNIFRPRSFEFFITGISDSVGEIEFSTPVINGRIVSALTTAEKNLHIDSFTRNIMDFVKLYVEAGNANSFKIHSFASPITTID